MFCYQMSGSSNTPWIPDLDTASTQSSYDPDSSSTVGTGDPDTTTVRPVNDYTQTILVIGVTVAFALTLAIGGSVSMKYKQTDRQIDR